jgi:hypothetical protein
MNTFNTSPGDLAGQVIWRRPQGGLRNARPELVNTVSAGRTAQALPGLVSALLAMCSQAHLLASRLVVDAARGQARALSEEEAHTLQLETLREHLRRLWLDWPRGLQGQHDASISQLQALHQAPVLQGSLSRVVAGREAVLDATRGWLADQVFDMPPEVWLTHWLHGGEAWLAGWCATSTTAPARLLAAVQATARAISLPVHGLRPDDEAALRQLAMHLATEAGHARQPAWPLDEAETGPGCRLHEAQDLTTPRSLWWRMAARLADLARLTLPDHLPHAAHKGDQPVRSIANELGPNGRHVLQHGSLSLPGHAGLAWVEMARGTLIHWVQLDGDGPQAKVIACQVVAPTEWNFHPQGPVARLLSALPDDAGFAAHAALVVAAFDPCVPFAIEGADDPRPAEHRHA